ncbi:phosphorylase [Sphingomonas glacialis]|uniref:Phosphorylase n=1 Tax=Sphingomonas glacialis TaxID=658225 RepID=A0A502G1G6_9SPHN|nr:phosphorylase [Sphingomonas glacialis]TPG54933.1 phosphorylase [Sphingomonas glacialis]
MTLLVACGLHREAAIIARPGVVVVAGGGDSARLERELEAAVAGAFAVLSCGVAGALDPRLRAGDVVVGTLHHSRHPGPVPGSTVPRDLRPEHARHGGPRDEPGVTERVGAGREFIGWLARHLPEAYSGTIIGADTIIASAAEKAALYAQTGAIAVDMESHIAARVAARHNLPFAILRTISDSADHALPPAALVGMNPDGSVALGAILKSLAKNPAQLPALLRTGRDAGAAFRALGRALGALEAVGIGRLDLRELGLDMR